MENTLEELRERFEFLEHCCMHEAQWRPQDVARLVAWHEGEPDGEAEIVVVELEDGHFGVMISSEDYTGHGCRCDSYTCREPTFEAALSHLTEDEQRELLAGREAAQ